MKSNERFPARPAERRLFLLDNPDLPFEHDEDLYRMRPDQERFPPEQAQLAKLEIRGWGMIHRDPSWRSFLDDDPRKGGLEPHVLQQFRNIHMLGRETSS